MSWGEFSALLSGLLPETPLGQIVSIRSETDSKIIEKFTSGQKKIYEDWQKFLFEKHPEFYDKSLSQIEKIFLALR